MGIEAGFHLQDPKYCISFQVKRGKPNVRGGYSIFLLSHHYFPSDLLALTQSLFVSFIYIFTLEAHKKGGGGDDELEVPKYWRMPTTGFALPRLLHAR